MFYCLVDDNSKSVCFSLFEKFWFVWNHFSSFPAVNSYHQRKLLVWLEPSCAAACEEWGYLGILLKLFFSFARLLDGKKGVKEGTRKSFSVKLLPIRKWEFSIFCHPEQKQVRVLSWWVFFCVYNLFNDGLKTGSTNIITAISVVVSLKNREIFALCMKSLVRRITSHEGLGCKNLLLSGLTKCLLSQSQKFYISSACICSICILSPRLKSLVWWKKKINRQIFFCWTVRSVEKSDHERNSITE